MHDLEAGRLDVGRGQVDIDTSPPPAGGLERPGGPATEQSPVATPISWQQIARPGDDYVFLVLPSYRDAFEDLDDWHHLPLWIHAHTVVYGPRVSDVTLDAQGRIAIADVVVNE